jgi:hypothetical protein
MTERPHISNKLYTVPVYLGPNRLTVRLSLGGQPPLQSSRGDTHALSSFCDERREG